MIKMCMNCLILFYLSITCLEAAIVPEELPSLLSEIYFNIPQMKKGMDSRIGFGFSLGNHADFQIVYEIGPQKNTVPYGKEYSENSRRHVKNSRKKSWKRQKVATDLYADILTRIKNIYDKMTSRKKLRPNLLPIPSTLQIKNKKTTIITESSHYTNKSLTN